MAYQKEFEQYSHHFLPVEGKKRIEEGYCKGDTCNRDGCKGIIEEHDIDGCCSCHSNPPCSYCTTPKEYCPECDWDAEEEAREYYNANMPTPEQEKQWEEERRKRDESDKIWQQKMSRKIPFDKFECRSKSHTHFSMEVEGGYPAGMTRGDVYDKLKGTFGGRFTYFHEGIFRFIAYTD